MKPQSQTARLAIYLRARRRTWVSALMLMRVGGWLRWRTSVSELRRAPYFMNVVNRQTRLKGRAVMSEYRYEP